MGDTTNIEWTDKTWNPWHGCRKVSAGCKYCYMYRDKERYGQDPTTVLRSKTTFSDPLKWSDPAKVFTCSWSDFFIEEADDWRDEAWDIIRETPHLTYQILTKRPERIWEHLPNDWGEGWINVWLGVSVENQSVAKRRLDSLFAVPASTMFLSIEPLLGPLDLRYWLHDGATRLIDWVIVGGESGPQARPMKIAWARFVIQQCENRNVPVFLKQLGGYPDKRGGDKAIIDGRRWQQFPDVQPTGQLKMEL